MKKRTLLLVVPTLLTALVGTSCSGEKDTATSGDKTSTTNTTPVSTPTTSTTSSSSITKPDVKNYTYGEIESMGGSLNANVNLSVLGGMMSVGLKAGVPMTLNYQVANEEIDPNRVLQYVKFHFSLDIGSKSELLLGTAGYEPSATTSTFYGLTNSLVSLVGALTGSSDGTPMNFFNGTPFAYGEFSSDDYDEAPKIKSIDFDYNADGKLYISVMGSSVAPVLNEEGEYEFEKVHSLGTTMVDLNQIISQVMILLQNFKDSGEINFKTILSFLANINESIPEIEVDLGKVIKVISCFAFNAGNGEFGIKLNDEGIKSLNTMIASLIPEEYASFVTLPKISSVSANYTTENHYVLVDVRTSQVINGFSYDDSMLNFSFFDTESADSVFTSTTLEKDYEDTVNALKLVENVVGASSNIRYTQDSVSDQNRVITDTEKALESTSKSYKEKVGNVLNVIGIEEQDNNKVFSQYVEGMDLLNTFETTISSYDADPTKWSDEQWNEVASDIENILDFGDFNIIYNSYLTNKLMSVIDAYETHNNLKEAELQAEFLKTSAAVREALDKYEDKLLNGFVASVAVNALTDISKAIYIGTDEVKPLVYFDAGFLNMYIDSLFTTKDYAAYGVAIKYVYDTIVAAQEKLDSTSDATELSANDFVKPLKDFVMPLYIDGTFIGEYFDESNSFNSVIKNKYNDLATVISDFNFDTEDAITYLAGTQMRSSNWVVKMLDTFDVKPADVATSTDLTALNSSLTKLNKLVIELDYILNSTDSLITENNTDAKEAIESYKQALEAKISELNA